VRNRSRWYNGGVGWGGEVAGIKTTCSGKNGAVSVLGLSATLDNQPQGENLVDAIYGSLPFTLSRNSTLRVAGSYQTAT
jgi:hypothetical protein